MQKYWINVIPKERVTMAVTGGIMQSEGNEAHLNRMDRDDWVIFYSPRIDLTGTIKLQSFTAVGQIADEDEEIFTVELSPGMKAFRRKMNYLQVKETPLIPLIQKLTFIRNKKHWGSVFKMNLFEIPEEDFKLITKEMENQLPIAA